MKISIPEFRTRFSGLSGNRKLTDAELFNNLLKSLSKKSSEKAKMEF